MKKILTLVLALCLVILAGCGGGSQNSQPTQETSQEETNSYKITLIVKNLVNPMWLAVKEGAEAAAKEYGVELTVLAPLKADNNEEQIRQVEDAITKQADAIVLIPADSQGIIPAVEKANQAGIPVINVNTKVGGGVTETFVAVENYDAASKVAEAVAEKLGQKGKVIILEGKAGAQSAIDLKQGAVDTFAKYEGIEIVASQTANWNRAEAMQVTQNLLQAHPDVNAIFASNDEMAMGAVEAVDQAGLTGKIIIAGLDANQDALEAIKEGKMTLTCDKRGFEQGYVGVEAAVKVLNNEPVDDRIVIDTTIVDESNVDEFLK
ncbi:sugar ABC transporter substrate-binding protein [Tepidanaerobacter sp. GT38]|uniref:sugar ABC transporter substrate-binding protein n=1 Tax=Tepidanaerobacter sp. GT38 TaxID=2722793 RepID=UPI001F176779|nr:sugar ABC transporter substrate-binding protein [Tepidanaerobacter sp. GT38]